MDKQLRKFGLICSGIFVVLTILAAIFAPMFLKKEEPPQPQPIYRHAISKIITSYVGVQLILSEQIYANDQQELLEASKDLYKSVKEALALDPKEIPAGDADVWETMLTDLQKAAEPIAGWNDMNASRVFFKKASDRLILIIEKFGHAHCQDIYVMYCSMAFDDTGACWIQGSEKLRNPYFGKKMLECGTVKKVFPSVAK